MTALDIHRAPNTDRTRPVAAVGAAVIGLAAGVAFGEPFLAFAERVWTGFLLPAYLEIQKSGIPFCG